MDPLTIALIVAACVFGYGLGLGATTAVLNTWCGWDFDDSLFVAAFGWPLVLPAAGAYLWARNLR